VKKLYKGSLLFRRLLHTRELHALVKAHDAILLTNAEIGKNGLLQTASTGNSWMAKLVALLLATAALWVRIQTTLKNSKWATSAKEWQTHSTRPQKNQDSRTNMRKVLSSSCRIWIKADLI
jgi:hypothetical protein